jgi:hypothetical protein
MFEHRRRNAEDDFIRELAQTHRMRLLRKLSIVSHIPRLILKYDCHINAEFTTLFQYLFKYVFGKPPDQASWKVKKQPSSTSDIEPRTPGRKTSG